MVRDDEEDNEKTAWYQRPVVWIVAGTVWCLLVNPCTVSVLVYLFLVTYLDSLSR